MVNYANGDFPMSLFIEVPGQEGDDAYLTPTVANDWLALKKYVLDTYGVVIWIMPGFNAYRPRPNQVIAKNAAIAEGRPLDAATPGTSSHGGRYIQSGSPRDGHESLAIDVGGYQKLDRADWYAACRKYGFEPGFFDWEPWHIIHWRPQFGVSVPVAGSGGTASQQIASILGENDMEAYISAPNGVVTHLRGGGKQNFATASEYNTFRDEVAFLVKAKAADMLVPPALKDVPKVGWDTFKRLCAHLGAPEK